MSPSAGEDQSWILFYLILALSLRHVECGVAAAAGGAAHVLLKGGVGGVDRVVDEDREALIMLMMACVVVGVVLVGILVLVYKGVRRYVFKIKDPPKSFVVDKKVKCKSGHNMMKFHVPDNVSSYIKCSSQSACEKKDLVAGFAAWFSCPVCAYRICSGCASVDVPDFANKDKFSVENLLSSQFAQFGTKEKNKPPVKETQDGNSPLPGQVC